MNNNDRNFLEQLYGSAKEGFLVLWESTGRRSKFFTTEEIPKLSKEATKMAATKNVYYGVGLLKEKLQSGRGKIEDVIGIGALWLDLDVAGPNHKSKDLPTEEQARRMLETFPLKPSVIVQSGGGFHVYWLLNKVWIFGSEEEKNEAQKLIEKLQSYFRIIASQQGLTIDSTHDLSRLLRLPGTLNHKDNQPKKVEIIECDYTERYTPCDVLEALNSFEQGQPSQLEVKDSKPMSCDSIDAEPIFNRCAFIRHCRDDAESLSEPEWYAALSILARCKDGGRICHEISKPYPEYSDCETQRKIRHALNDTGPATCERIRNDFNHCSDCLEAVNSPIVLGRNNRKTSSSKNTKSLKTTQLSTVEEEEVAWLWYPYIPYGKLTLLEGDPGSGKTWIALQLAARVSRGDIDTDGGPGSVMVVTAEDGISDTIVPRLKLMGADLDNIHAIEGIQNENGEIVSMFSFNELEILDKTMETIKPRLLIIDPIQAFLGKGVDMHKANDVRNILSPLIKLVEKYNCALICIRHLNKNSGNKGLYRGMGSIDFTAAARSVLVVAPNNEVPGTRSMAHMKASLGSIGPTMNFVIGDNSFEWVGESDVTAEDLLNPNVIDRSCEPEQVTWLRALLSDGRLSAKDAQDQGIEEGFTKKQLRRAKEKLGVKSIKVKEVWYWELPSISAGERCPSPTSHVKLGHLGHVGQDGHVEKESKDLDRVPQNELKVFSRYMELTKILTKEYEDSVLESKEPIQLINYKFKKALNEHLEKNPIRGYYYSVLEDYQGSMAN